jgi:pilus assembly protein CpaE
MQIAGRVESSMDIAAATKAGRPIMSEDPKHPSSQALQDLALRLTGEPVAPDSAPGSGSSQQSQQDRKSGLFRRKR